MEPRNESLVFVGQHAQKLRFIPSAGHPVLLHGPPPRHEMYVEGVDYVVDYGAGTIRRTSQSRIPDWRAHPLYALDPFDHREFSTYSNKAFTCEVEYTPLRVDDPIHPFSRMGRVLPRLYDKLRQSRSVHYVVYGDSISAGYEASRSELAYPVRFADALRKRHPSSDIYLHRKAVGGETSRGGLRRLAEEVLPIQPDLITIAYGMNDQNRSGNGRNAISIDEFEQNLLEMIRLFRQQSEGEIILLTPCLPNPKWIFASKNVSEYGEAIRRIGQMADVPVADVQRLWVEELAAGKTHESLLLNNLNHPNDYGHSLYFAALQSLLS